MIIGFGETEKRYEERLEDNLRNSIAENYAQNSDSCFTDEFIEETKKFVAEAAKNSQEQADLYKEATEYPDRYSRYWSYVVGDCNYIAVILSFHHINRRHGLSPDGWAMMQSEKVFCIRAHDINKAKDAA